MHNIIRTGIVGAGMMGMQHVEAVRRIPGIEVVALADTNLGNAQRTCEKLCIPRAYGDYQQMIEQEELDAIHICTPNFTHYEIAKAAVNAGINVLCEKPLANYSRQTAELAALAKTKEVIAAVNFNYRQNVIVREMRSLLAEPSWGRTFLIRGEYIQDWMMYDTDYNWRCIPEINGDSRTIADIGSHWFDAIQFITGKKIVRVLAKTVTVHQKRKKFTNQAQTFQDQTGDDYQLVDIKSEDAAFILFETEDGIPGTLTLSQVSSGYKNGMVISIDGESNSLTWEQENPDKLLIRNRKTGTNLTYAASGCMHGEANLYTTLPAGHAVGWADGVKNSVNAFYRAVKGEENPEYASFSDGDGVVRIVEACLESAKKNTWVDVKQK